MSVCDTSADSGFGELSKEFTGRAAYDGGNLLVTSAMAVLHDDGHVDKESVAYVSGTLDWKRGKLAKLAMHLRLVIALHNTIQKREQRKQDVRDDRKRKAEELVSQRQHKQAKAKGEKLRTQEG